MYANRLLFAGKAMLQRTALCTSGRNLNYTHRTLTALTSKRFENIQEWKLSPSVLDLQSNRHLSVTRILRKYNTDSGDESDSWDYDLPSRPPRPPDALELTKNAPEFFPIIPIIPYHHALFPKFMKLIEISDKALIKTIQRRIELGLPYVGIFLRKDLETKSEMIKSVDEVHKVGVFVCLTEVQKVDGKIQFLASAVRRIRLISNADEDQETKSFTELKEKYEKEIKKELEDGLRWEDRENMQRSKFLQVIPRTLSKKEEDKQAFTAWAKNNKTYEDVYGPRKDYVPGQITIGVTENVNFQKCDTNSQEYKAVSMAIVEAIREIIMMNPIIRDSLQQVLGTHINISDDPSYLADLSAAVTSASQIELQEVLEEENAMARLNKSLTLLKKEQEMLKLQQKIGREVEEKVKKQSKQFLLREQLKAIKRELGIEKDDKDALWEKFEANLKGKVVPATIDTVIKEEYAKLSYLETNSSEFGVTRNYLDWLTSLPWGLISEEKIKDIDEAAEILNEDHFGMDDIKKRILEFIAVNQLKGTTQGKILCFHGPPGVGKTSIARSIAKALNRQYYRFSVGGMTDVAEIKGHRRTYVGSMPGKIIQCLKKTQTENPLILIDEIDKIGRHDHRGDPSSALLELLDPEQNANYLDHFLDVNVDLSKVLFICTANMIDTIPDPLRDRMELIEMSGYVAEEKISIAKKYLIPKALDDCGVTADQMEINEDALSRLIKNYCRESGVRNLQKQIEKIARKTAFKLVKNDPDGLENGKYVVTAENLEVFNGKPVFTQDRIYDITPPGVVMGLAWTSMGGSTLFIETVKRVLASPPTDNKKPSTGSLHVTGHLGDVMKESSQIALTVARNFLNKLDPSNTFLETSHLHLHVPEGATKKDGPSAGITIVTALTSLALEKPVKHDVAMTGEVSLTGKVLPVGGIKEKIIAAKRAGVKEIILPAENLKDLVDLADYIKDGLEFHFVEQYSEVYDLVF